MLVDQVSSVDPEVRIRFTSPHPKDFPDDLIQLIGERPNVCSNVHLPAQSGSSAVLERMRRGYTRDAYLALVERMRLAIPDLTLSTDIIVGFCGETEEEHEMTVSLMEQVQFDMAFMFKYSTREKTHAHRTMKDDVPEAVKHNRLKDVIDTFYSNCEAKNQAELGKVHLVLVEGPSKRNTDELIGRSCTNKKIIFPSNKVPQRDDVLTAREPARGDYVAVRVDGVSAQSLRGTPLMLDTMAGYYSNPIHEIIGERAHAHATAVQ